MCLYPTAIVPQDTGEVKWVFLRMFCVARYILWVGLWLGLGKRPCQRERPTRYLRKTLHKGHLGVSYLTRFQHARPSDDGKFHGRRACVTAVTLPCTQGEVTAEPLALC